MTIVSRRNEIEQTTIGRLFEQCSDWEKSPIAELEEFQVAAIAMKRSLLAVLESAKAGGVGGAIFGGLGGVA